LQFTWDSNPNLVAISPTGYFIVLCAPYTVEHPLRVNLPGSTWNSQD
jgi:hypothetical protein